jgi:hypothetical protein
MYEALVERVRYHIQKASFMGLKDAESTLLLAEAADAIEELSREIDIDNAAMTAMDAAMPRWIPVTEAENLPRGEVLALNNLKGSYGYHEYLIGYVDENCESDSGYFCESEGEILMNVTHWMPLPEPPKEET